MEYYKNGKAKLIGLSSTVEPLTFEGQHITYFESGKKSSVTTYSNGKISGLYYVYHPNGLLRRMENHPDSLKNRSYFEQSLLMSYNDSTGKAIIADGKGYYTGGDFRKDSEEGYIVSGKKEGIWKGRYKDGAGFAEEYKNGVLIQGTYTGVDNKKLTYTAFENMPEFPGGLAKFMKFIQSNTQYPQSAREIDVQGKVWITFVVNKDGSLSEFKIERGIHPDFDREALRVVKLSPLWKPGMQNGVPVRVLYKIPVTFSLN
ncbi:MAG: TonB family protein [Sphingobacteriaceae bacterium]|nr:MAG: TonB family protein [Sphingobacteriaceae bacterium]